MARKSNNNETNESSNEPTVMNGSAVGIVKTAAGGYAVVKLEINSETNSMLVTKTIEVGPSKMEAAERFKVLAVEEGLVV